MRALMIVGLAALLSSASQSSAATAPFSRTIRLDCGSSAGCGATFPLLPAGTRWEVRQFGCFAVIEPVTAAVTTFALRIRQGTTVVHTYPFVAVSSGVLNGVAYWVTQDDVFIPVASGRGLQALELVSPDPTAHAIECVVSGVEITN